MEANDGQCLNLLRHDLRVPMGSLSRFNLSLPQCNVPDVLNCMSGFLVLTIIQSISYDIYNY